LSLADVIYFRDQTMDVLDPWSNLDQRLSLPRLCTRDYFFPDAVQCENFCPDTIQCDNLVTDAVQCENFCADAV